jgi:hypothetical protein
MAMSDQPMRESDKNKDRARRGSEGTIGTAHGDNSGDTAAGQQGGMIEKARNVGMDVARNVGEQARTVAATAQDVARRAGEQTYEGGQRAGEYLTRNVNEYPLAALMVAGAIGYGVAYLVHSNWQNQGWNWNWSSDNSDNGRRNRRHDHDSDRHPRRS